MRATAAHGRRCEEVKSYSIETQEGIKVGVKLSEALTDSVVCEITYPAEIPLINEKIKQGLMTLYETPHQVTEHSW